MIEIEPITPEAQRTFNEAAERYKTMHRIKGLVAVAALLACSYGLVFYFVFSTILHGLKIAS